VEHSKLISKALILGGITSKAELRNIIEGKAVVLDAVEAKGNIPNKKIESKTEFTNIVTSKAIVINSGISSAPCPIIFCIDGGNASTLAYPPINGLLNGGSA